jgi:hypothetical protein
MSLSVCEHFRKMLLLRPNKKLWLRIHANNFRIWEARKYPKDPEHRRHVCKVLTVKGQDS